MSKNKTLFNEWIRVVLEKKSILYKAISQLKSQQISHCATTVYFFALVIFHTKNNKKIYYNNAFLF